MIFFTLIEGEVVIIRQNGIFRQVPLAARGNALYAKIGTGYVQLGGAGSTSAPNTKWIELSLADVLFDAFKAPQLPTALGGQKLLTEKEKEL